MNIIVTYRPKMLPEDAYLAMIEGGDSRASMGTGSTKEEALGNLMILFPETFGIVEISEK